MYYFNITDKYNMYNKYVGKICNNTNKSTTCNNVKITRVYVTFTSCHV